MSGRYPIFLNSSKTVTRFLYNFASNQRMRKHAFSRRLISRNGISMSELGYYVTITFILAVSAHSSKEIRLEERNERWGKSLGGGGSQKEYFDWD